MSPVIISLIAVTLVSCGENTAVTDASGITRIRGESRIAGKFKESDIKNEFCGVDMGFQYCKCAFHNQYCGSIGMNKDEASAYVYGEFAKYEQERLSGFKEGCKFQNGFVDTKNRCNICEDPAVVKNGNCFIIKNPSKEKPALEDVAELNNCDIMKEDWMKYSDIDDRIENTDRSYEAKQYGLTQGKIITLMAEGFSLEYDTALLNEQLVVLDEYKQALVQNLRSNLIKATMRLTYITYSQINGAKGAGESFSTFLTSNGSIEALGAGMKAVQSVIPSDSRLAIDTKSVDGKLKSIGWNATLEVIDTMGNPYKVAEQVMKDAKGAIVPSADITPEEIEILRVQNLENDLLSDVILELQTKIAVSEARMEEIENTIAQLQSEAAQWEEKEKERVLLFLEEECSSL